MRKKNSVKCSACVEVKICEKNKCQVTNVGVKKIKLSLCDFNVSMNLKLTKFNVKHHKKNNKTVLTNSNCKLHTGSRRLKTN